jgi:hypothetical protein
VDLIHRQAALAQDRLNPDTVLKPHETVILDAALKHGVVSRSDLKKPFKEWSPEKQKAWQGLQDRVAPGIQAWKSNPANQGKRLSNEELEGMVDKVAQRGTLKGTGFIWNDDATVEQAAARPPAEQRKSPWVPDLSSNDRTEARALVQSLGFAKGSAIYGDDTKLWGLLQRKKELASGPGAQRREQIVQFLKGRGNPYDDASVMRFYVANELQDFLKR